MSDTRRVRLAAALDALGPSTPCLEPDTLLAFYAGELEAGRAAAVCEHLSTCSACLELARDARLFVDALGTERPARLVERPRPSAFAALGWAAVFLLALSGLWLAQPSVRGPGESPARAGSSSPTPRAAGRLEIQVSKAPYAPPGVDDVVWRGAPERHVLTPLERALEPYVQDDFAEAERRLAAHLGRHPGDVRARFYRGVALLMLDRPGEAAALLEPLAGQAGELADELDWYLALSYLKSDEVARALPSLDRLGRGGSTRRADALALRARLSLRP